MTITDHARAYIGLGWCLCSIPPGTKGPNTSGWNRPGAIIDTLEQAMSAAVSRPNSGFGLVHGPSGTCAIDIDHLEYAMLALAELGIDLAAEIQSAPQIIGRPGRGKAIFRLTPAMGGLKTHKLVWPPIQEGGKPTTVIEFRAGPVQDVLPPTVHPDTEKPYTWMGGEPPASADDIPELPQLLLNLWQLWDKIKPQLEAACPWAPKAPPPPQRNRLPGPHSNVIGQFNAGHDVLTMLKHFGYQPRGKRLLAPTSQSGLAGVVVLEDGRCYSHHASDPLNDGHAHDAFDLYCLFSHGGDVTQAVRSAAEMVHLNSLPDLPVVDSKPMLDTAKRKAKAEAAAKSSPAAQSIPGDLTRVPGVLGLLCDHIVASAIKPQRMLAVASALAFGAVCMSRIYASKTDLRTNPYLIAVAPSTAGKDHGRKVLRSALIAAGLKDRLGGEDIKSGSAVFSAVTRSPALVFQLDEFGLFLKAVTNPSAGSHQADILRQLMIMRTSAASVVMGPEYAASAQRKRDDIEYPCVIVHATTTGDSFWPVLSSAQVIGGFLNRFLVVHAEGPGERQTPQRRTGDIPDAVTEWAAQVRAIESMPNANLLGINPATPKIIGESSEAARLLTNFADMSDEQAQILAGTGLDALWGRAHAQAVEIALIVAGSLSPSEPVINELAAKWAISFVEYWTRRLVADCGSRIVDQEFEARCAAVLRVLEQGATPDKSYTRREIAKVWRGWRTLRPAEQFDIMKALVQNGDAVAGKRQGARGPASEAWIARAFAADEVSPNDDQNENPPTSMSASFLPEISL